MNFTLSDHILSINREEYDSLRVMFKEMNGNRWIWSNDMESIGIQWSFSGNLISDPCFDHWQGIQCSCDTNFTAHRPYAIPPPSEDDYYYAYNYNTQSIGPNCTIWSINLMRNNLTGKFPANFINLQNLRELHFGYNHISGTFPSVISELPNLEILSEFTFHHKRIKKLPFPLQISMGTYCLEPFHQLSQAQTNCIHSTYRITCSAARFLTRSPL
jgi:hypothetical protein